MFTQVCLSYCKANHQLKSILTRVVAGLFLTECVSIGFFSQWERGLSLDYYLCKYLGQFILNSDLSA